MLIQKTRGMSPLKRVLNPSSLAIRPMVAMKLEE